MEVKAHDSQGRDEFGTFPPLAPNVSNPRGRDSASSFAVFKWREMAGLAQLYILGKGGKDKSGGQQISFADENQVSDAPLLAAFSKL